MAKANIITCDYCGRSKKVDESTGRPWLVVQTATTKEEYAGILQRVQGGEDLDNLSDYGDFCSLECVSNWASVRANLRSLDDDGPSLSV